MIYGIDKPIIIWSRGDYISVLQQAINIYKRDINSDIQFSIVPVEEWELHERLSNLQSNNYPSIILVEDVLIQKYLLEFPNMFINLENELDTTLIKSYKIPFLSDVEGHIVGCPCSSGTVALYYRKDIFLQYGFTLSNNLSWEDFIMYGQDIKYQDNNKYLLPPINTFASYLMQSTGQLFYDENGNVSSQYAEDVCDLINQLSNYELIPTTMNYDEINNNIISGNILAVIGEPYNFSRIKNLALDSIDTQEWAVVNIPKSSILSSNVNIGNFSWMVVRQENDEPNTDYTYVFDFLTRMFNTDDEISEELYHLMAEDYDMVPAVNYMSNSLSDLTNNGCFIGNVIEFLDSLDSDVSNIYYGQYTLELNNYFNQLSSNLVDGLTTTIQLLIDLGNALVDHFVVEPEAQLDYIEKISPPDNIEYYKNERFNPTGMLIRVWLTDGSHYEITPNYRPLLSVGDTNITITYTFKGRSRNVQQTISVSDRTPIGLNAEPSDDYYLHTTTLNNADFIVYVVYNIGQPYRTSNFEIMLPYIGDTARNQSFEIVYTEGAIILNANVPIIVVKKLESVSLLEKPKKMVYSQGERINLNGIKVLAEYSDGSTENVYSGMLDCWPEYACFEPGCNTKEIEVFFRRNGIVKIINLVINKKVGAEIDDANITQDFGDSGFGTINLKTGKYRYYFDDFSNDNPTLPINLSRSYDFDSSYQSYIGQGWRFNYQQELYLNSDNKWVYSLYDGKEYIFECDYPTDNNRSSIRNEILGLDLFIDDLTSKITLIDRSNNSMLFEQVSNAYKLTKILNYPSKTTDIRDAYTLEIEYDNYGKIINITAGAPINGIRPSIDFIYADNKLSYIEYLGTRVCEYNYYNDKLNYVIKKNTNVGLNYLEKTTFVYSNNQLSVFNNKKKDLYNNYYGLRYLVDSNTNKVSSFSFGYNQNDFDTTTITYHDVSENLLDENAIQTSVVLTNRNIVTVVTLNKYQVVSSNSYKIDNIIQNPILKPKMIMNCQCNGINLLSIYDKYADDLVLLNNDFENGVEGWQNSIIDTTACICGTQSIRSNNGYITKTFTELNLSVETTCFVSFWYMDVWKICITIVKGDDEYFFELSQSRMLHHWQYFACPLGKILSSSVVTIRLEGSNARLDDFKIFKSPYETPENNQNTEQDEFGKTKYIREYTPLENKFYLTRYYYDLDHQCRLIQKIDGTEIVEENRFDFQDGIQTSSKQYNPAGKYLETSSIYTNDICVGTSSLNGENSTISFSPSEINTINIGEIGSPNSNYKQKLYEKSDFLKSIEEDNFKNNYIYNENGDISRVESGYNAFNNSYSTIIDFLYDSYENNYKVRIGNIDLITQVYDSKKKLSKTYANGDAYIFIYDNEERLVSVKNGNDDEIFGISYIDNTKTATTITHNNGMTYNTNTIWEDSKINQYIAQTPNYNGKLKVINYASNSYGNESTREYYNSNSSIPFEKVIITNNKDGKIESIRRTLSDAALTSYEYDYLHRLSSKNVRYVHVYSYKNFKKNYTYKNIDSNRTTTLVETEKLSFNSNMVDIYRYEYYVNGNISRIFKDNILQNEYIYDSHNRLINEINFALNRKYVYEYDNGGNITSKKIYSIENGIISSTPFIINTYDYCTITSNYGQNPSWGDQLKSYNNSPISYDACGNLTSYLGNNLVWNGKLLKSFNTINMEYDYNGLRIKKGDNIYYWYNGNIILECFKDNQNNEKFIYYHYDETGVCGMYYDNQEYFFEKNIFGDILAIYDSNGILKCRYSYDSYGNHKIYDENNTELCIMSLNIGNINPFRYRGYYYDKDFNLYYLKTRYYNSYLGRFISPEAISNANPKSVIGYNLYAYGNDNPMMILNLDSSSVLCDEFADSPVKYYFKHSHNRYALKNPASILMLHETKSLIWDSSYSDIAKALLLDVSITKTIQDRSVNGFYCYSDYGNDSNAFGFGLNFKEYCGVSFGVTSNIGFVKGGYIGNFVYGAEVSLLGGVSINLGSTEGNVTTTYSFSVGWPLILAPAFAYTSVAAAAGKTLAEATTLILLILGIFKK